MTTRAEVDICMIVEGTYPYVSGGVSSWIHSLITNLPELHFGLVYIGASPDPARVPQYTLPDNVVSLDEIALHDTRSLEPQLHACPHADLWRDLGDFHAALTSGDATESTARFARLMPQIGGNVTLADLLFSRESWDLLVARYGARCPASPFRDVFWTFRATHLPLFRLMEAAVPPARIYHSPSTGFSGLLGAMAKMRTGAPLIVTEHGVYQHEREIEIAQSAWIADYEEMTYRLDQPLGFFKEWWVGIFRFMTQVTYDLADEVISVTTGNQRYQRHDGAAPRKMSVIPNGVDIARYGDLRASLGRAAPGFHVGFVGRVVPIKDVKTFIRAVGIARESIGDLTASIVGPTDEDPGYYEECRRLVTMLGLDDTIHFTGRADVRDYYRTLDVLALTSISEAAPLVILEANCAGVPVVATNVGACRELLEGEQPEDQAIGPSGILTTVSSAQETAEALIQIARDEDLRLRMARAGQERTRRFYDVRRLYATYRDLYQGYLQRDEIPLTGD